MVLAISIVISVVSFSAQLFDVCSETTAVDGYSKAVPSSSSVSLLMGIEHNVDS